MKLKLEKIEVEVKNIEAQPILKCSYKKKECIETKIEKGINNQKKRERSENQKIDENRSWS